MNQNWTLLRAEENTEFDHLVELFEDVDFMPFDTGLNSTS
jgi:hypothetical protein